ncbi:hypothetical protein LCGC14_1580400, partial [marine sediment metagenome]
PDLLLGPPLAESPRPPILIGRTIGEEIEIETPRGPQRFAIPAPTRVEIITRSAPAAGAVWSVRPSVIRTVPSPGGTPLPETPPVLSGRIVSLEVS